MYGYAIYIGSRHIATVETSEAAQIGYEAAATLADITGEVACLVWLANGEIIASTDKKGE